jgi:hypothetical protein
MASDSPIISIHIPKTAGTRFRQALQQAFGSGVALYYGSDDPRTHPLLRDCPFRVPVDVVARLAGSGIAVIHGHFRARRFLDAVPDPSRYWVWLREPIEHTISHHYFLLGRDGAGAAPPRRRQRQTAATLEEFLTQRRAQNIQSHYVAGSPIEAFGFVGITEHFEAMTALLGLADPGRGANANEDKPLRSLEERQKIVAVVGKDLALYSWALESAMRTLDRRSVDRRGAIRRLLDLAKSPGSRSRAAATAERSPPPALSKEANE